jgi:hypothetical protein
MSFVVGLECVVFLRLSTVLTILPRGFDVDTFSLISKIFILELNPTRSINLFFS